MEYRYGDSTLSPLTSNFLEFLRDAIDLSVLLLQADNRIAERKARIQSLRETADAQAQQVEAFVNKVMARIEEASTEPIDTPAGHCATQLRVVSAEVRRTTLQRIEGKVREEVSRLQAEDAAERAACAQAPAAMLVAQYPPETSPTLTRVLLGPSGVYELTRSAKAAFGLSWVLALEVPEGHFWSSIVRVEQLSPALEILAPAVSGWINKELKLRPLRIDKYIVTELTDDGETIRVRLRASPTDEQGFDLAVNIADKHLTVTRVGDPDAGEFVVQAEDEPKLLELIARARPSIESLKPRRLVQASFAGVALRELPTYAEFVESLILLMAPIVREISRHSPKTGELVLRRMLSDDRREEIFVTREALREKYEPLGEAIAKVFEPLELALIPQAPETPEEAAPESKLVRSELPPAMPPPMAVVAPVANQEPPAQPVVLSRHGIPINMALVNAFTTIADLLKDGKPDGAYRRFAELFSDPQFVTYRPEEQRRALRLMVLARKRPAKTDAAIEAHRAALGPLIALVEEWGAPLDYEMLGVAHLAVDDSAAAREAFETGLAIECAMDPDSEVCASLTRRLVALP
jgi:hypothetical protein